MKLTKPWTPEIFMECYYVARNQPIRREITKPQKATVISLWFLRFTRFSWTLLWLASTQSTFLKFFSCCSRFSEFDSKCLVVVCPSIVRSPYCYLPFTWNNYNRGHTISTCSSIILTIRYSRHLALISIHLIPELYTLYIVPKTA